MVEEPVTTYNKYVPQIEKRVNKIFNSINKKKKLEEPYIWREYDFEIKGPIQIKEEAKKRSLELLSQNIGWIIEESLKLYSYPKIVFHEKTVYKRMTSPIGYSDKHFYVDDRENYRKCLSYKLIKEEYTEKIANDLVETPDQFYQWIEDPSDIKGLRTIAGHIGSGKSTFIRHTMLEYINNHVSSPPEEKRIFFYLDCNPDIKKDYRKASMKNKNSTQWWINWFVEKLYQKLFTDYISAREGNTERLIDNMKHFPKLSDDVRREPDLDKAFKNIRKEKPEIALEYIIWYITERYPEDGVPVIIIDNVDPGPTVAQVAAWDLLLYISEEAVIKTLLPVRTTSWLAMGDEDSTNKLSILSTTYILSPLDIPKLITKRLENFIINRFIARSTLTRLNILDDLIEMENIEIIEDQKLKDMLTYEYTGSPFGSYVAFKFIGISEKQIKNIIEGALCDESMNFINLYSNGNARNAITIISNFFKWGGGTEERALTHLFIENVTLPYHRVIRRIITQGKWYLQNEGTRKIDPTVTSNIFKTSCSSFCKLFLKYRLIYMTNVYKNKGGLNPANLLALYPLCSYYKKGTKNTKTMNCFNNTLNYLLRKEMLISTCGIPNLFETYKFKHSIFLTHSGQYYLNSLIPNIEYIAAAKFNTDVSDEWYGRWESPMEREPIIWKLASNTEFIHYLATCEKKYIQDLMKGKDVNQKLTIKLALNGELVTERILKTYINNIKNDRIKNFIENNEVTHPNLKRDYEKNNRILKVIFKDMHSFSKRNLSLHSPNIEETSHYIG